MNKVSVIVPVYNGEKTIKDSLLSLIKQTISIDIIVINDGSTDNTEKIVKELDYQYNNIHYFYKENSGIASTRNFGISKVETEYFGFLDADDKCKPDTYERMLKEIERTNSDICISDFMWVYYSDKKYQVDTGYKDKHELLSKMYHTLWNKLYRTDWFRSLNIKFPDGLVYEDTSVLFRLGLHMDKVCYVNRALVDYTQLDKSITHTFDIKINDMIEVFKGIKEYYINNNAEEEFGSELEYLFIRFFLGSSYLRACRIEDPVLRKETLDKGWEFLTSNYPNFKDNKYLNNPGKKNKYFKRVNKRRYYSNVNLFRFLYKIGVIK